MHLIIGIALLICIFGIGIHAHSRVRFHRWVIFRASNGVIGIRIVSGYTGQLCSILSSCANHGFMHKLRAFRPQLRRASPPWNARTTHSARSTVLLRENE